MTLPLSKLIDGFLLTKEIAGMSKNTLRNYRLSLHRLTRFFDDDIPVNCVSVDDLRRFLHDLQTNDNEPNGVAPRPKQPLSPKSVQNVHTCLSSFWSWAVEEGYSSENIVRKIQPPKPEEHEIEPFTREQVRALLYECRNNWNTIRDRAIIFFMLDNGVRASELCGLRVRDIDLKEQRALVWGKSRMNGGQGKQRSVPFGNRTTKSLWEYLAQKEVRDDDFVFTNYNGVPIDRRTLAKHLRRLGERAGVKNCHPHRFRHTFAIQYLRRGGDIFTLQKILGHSSLEMVKRYLAIASTDVESAHRQAGPVDNWKL